MDTQIWNVLEPRCDDRCVVDLLPHILYTTRPLTLTSEHAYNMRSRGRRAHFYTATCVYTELTVSTDKPNSKAFLPTTTTGYRRTNDSRCLLCSMQ